MLIDNSISEVFKRDKKVFIPDFGALIYSDFNDGIDVNELLNFDDGKIVEEIQKQESVSEEEAKSKLEEYVENLKSNLDEKGTYFIGGVGYINKGEDGELTVATSIAEPVFENEDEAIADEANEELVEEEIQNSEDAAPEMEEDQPDEPVEQNLEGSAEQVTNTEEEANSEEVTLATEEHEFGEDLDQEGFNEEAEDIEDDEIQEESIEPDYSYEAENDGTFAVNEEEQEPANKRRSPLLIALAAILLLAIIAVPLYLFVFKADSSESKVVSASVLPVTTEEVKTEPIQEEKDFTANEEETIASTQSEVSQAAMDSNHAITSDASGEKIYSLILGSFKVENNADNFEQHLNGKGIEANKFRRSGSFYFVGIEQIPGKPNAVALLSKLREEEEPTAWIIRKK